MCKACFLRKSEPLCDEYLDRYSEPFERSCQELAVAIKGLKYIKKKKRHWRLFKKQKVRDYDSMTTFTTSKKIEYCFYFPDFTFYSTYHPNAQEIAAMERIKKSRAGSE